MNLSAAVFLINDSVRAISCEYEKAEDNPKRGYYIFKTMDPTIVKDDLVIVPTHTRHGMTVVKVAEVDVDVDFDSDIQLKWIVGKVAQAPYEATLAAEAEAMKAINSAEKLKKRNELRDALLADNEGLKSLTIAALSPPGA